MTTARSTILRDGIEGSYHCVSRCVRRSFLCGFDNLTQRNYEHRKAWVLERLQALAGIFAIEVIGYAIMSNHLHLVLRNRPDVAHAWSDQEVARRWRLLFPLRRNPKTRLAEEPNELEISALVDAPMKLNVLRERLGSISWMMGKLNEWIARRANKEDNCKGRFWEGRFKCVALLGESAILSCLAYVDLNPIRAKAADTPETSDFTSGQDRFVASQASRNLGLIEKVKIDQPSVSQEQIVLKAKRELQRDKWLCPIQSEGNRKGALCISLDEYLKLLDWTGRQLCNEKPGVIPMTLEPILTRLDVNSETWLETVTCFGSRFPRAAGTIKHLRVAANEKSQHWFQGVKASKKAFLQHAA